MRRILLIAVVLTLPVIAQSGCGAARPSKYYQLNAPAPAATSPDPLPISLLVGRISSSRLFHDDRLIYETSPLEMGMYEYHRWAEPPADMVQGMLVQTLRASGQYRSVDRLGSSARGDYILRGRLLALQEVDHPNIVARVSFDLELFSVKTGTTVWTQSYSHDEPVTAIETKKNKKADVNVGAVVEALNRDLQQGVQQLTGDLGKYLASHPAQQAAR
jgi:ABC-type uncharacterized transport system auxiliary subunit